MPRKLFCQIKPGDIFYLERPICQKYNGEFQKIFPRNQGVLRVNAEKVHLDLVDEEKESYLNFNRIWVERTDMVMVSV